MYQKFGIFEPYEKYTKSEKVDEGRYAVTKNDSDKYVFKVPVLRNVAMTPPYFHDGSVDKLSDAVWIMGKIQLGKDLPKEQVQDIVAFLHALTGKIPEDVMARNGHNFIGNLPCQCVQEGDNVLHLLFCNVLA